MQIRELAHTIQKADAAMRPASGDSVAEHYARTYRKISLDGRDVFLLTDEREFGGRNHNIILHGSSLPAVPENIYQFVLLTWCYSGTFTQRIAGRETAISAGETLVMDRNVPHLVHETGPGDRAFNIVLSNRFFLENMQQALAGMHTAFSMDLASRDSLHAQWRAYPTKDDELVQTLMKEILCEHYDHRVGSDEMIDGLVAVLLTHLFRTYEDDAEAAREVQKRSELIGAIRSYIQKNYQERSLAAMAEEFGYRSTYLSALIRKTTGMTFTQMVNEERMKHAMLLLQTGSLPVYEVAESVGIANLTQFYRRFKDYVGCTPQQYRDKAMQAKLISETSYGH